MVSDIEQDSFHPPGFAFVAAGDEVHLEYQWITLFMGESEVQLGRKMGSIKYLSDIV
jgi:hypothetical protein